MGSLPLRSRVSILPSNSVKDRVPGFSGMALGVMALFLLSVLAICELSFCFFSRSFSLAIGLR